MRKPRTHKRYFLNDTLVAQIYSRDSYNAFLLPVSEYFSNLDPKERHLAKFRVLYTLCVVDTNSNLLWFHDLQDLHFCSFIISQFYPLDSLSLGGAA